MVSAVWSFKASLPCATIRFSTMRKGRRDPLLTGLLEEPRRHHTNAILQMVFIIGGTPIIPDSWNDVTETLRIMLASARPSGRLNAA